MDSLTFFSLVVTHFEEMILKLELIFKDRVDIVADVSAIIAENGFNISFMEVVRHEDRAHVYLGIEHCDEATQDNQILETLSKVADVVQIRLIDTLPYEERENRFQVVFDNIGDGVVSIDREGMVTTINRTARHALNCEENSVIGQSVKALNLPDFIGREQFHLL